MRIDELIVEVRDSNLERVGQILPTDLVGFKASLRFNNVGSWELSLPHDHVVGATLRSPGSGIVVTGPTGIILSGPTTSATNSKTADDPDGTWLIKGVDDSIALAERLAYPTPTSADVAAQTAAYDTRTGVASTVMMAYVEANLGASAPVSRQLTGLVTATDPIVGSTVYNSARFDVIGELVSRIASVDGLGFDVKQVDNTLEFSVYQPVDRSAYIRMNVKNNTLSKTEYAYGVHSLSRAIVAGSGAGTARQLVEVTSTESLSAETLWGRRIETFIDQRNTTDVDELNQAGIEALADGGATLTSIDVVPSSDLTMTYGTDWNLGDKVTVDVGGQEVSAIVTNVALTIEPDGVRVGATVGEPTGVDYEALVAKKSTTTTKRVNALERKEAASGGGGAASDVEIPVKNNTGTTLYKGQAVYITGSDGTNLNVALAKANAEITSSKTLGLLKQDLATGDHGSVITEGFLDDINTSGLTAGDPIWLSPTTPGGLVFGIANKPSAPNHLVFLGYVLRVQSNNGGYYVKVQNGFENDELHDTLTFNSDTPPASPKDYYYWFDTSTGALFYRYKDVDGSQWVQVNSTPAADTRKANLVGGNTFTGAQTLSSDAVSSKPLTVKGFTGQTANLQEWQDSSGAVVARVDSAGRLFTSKPIFSAYNLSSTANNAFCIYTSTNVNVGACYSTSTGRFTAPVAGVYVFNWTNIHQNNTVHRYTLAKNGVVTTNPEEQLRLDGLASGSEYVSNATKTAIIELAANDYVQLKFSSDDGSSAYAPDLNYPRFSGYLF